MLIAYLLLAVSIVSELIATSVLPATKGFRVLKPSLIAVFGYTLCFFCFGLTLLNLNLGIAYATWSAVGMIVTPIVGVLFYKQKITKIGVVGIVLIVVSVVSLNLYG